MRTLIVSEFITLDGVIQAPGGKDEDQDGGFEHGGWTWPYWHDDIGAAFGALMQGVDAFLLGRHTLLEHGLVDRLHLLLYPLTVDGGKRLFPEGVHPAFGLTGTKAYPSGVVGLDYEKVTS